MEALQTQFCSQDFNASEFVRNMYSQGSIPSSHPNGDETKHSTKTSLPKAALRAVRKGFGLNPTTKKSNTRSFQHQPHSDQPSTSDIIELEEKFEKNLKREIVNKYHVFITAAQDTRELTELVRRQNEQVEMYERTLEMLKRGPNPEVPFRRHRSGSIIGGTRYDTNTTHRRRRRRRRRGRRGRRRNSAHKRRSNSSGEEDSSSGEGASTSGDGGSSHDDDDSDDKQQDTFFSFYSGSPYAQLDVLIVQRRMEEATMEATRLIRAHRQKQEEQQQRHQLPTYLKWDSMTSASTSLNKRLDQLNHLILTGKTEPFFWPQRNVALGCVGETSNCLKPVTLPSPKKLKNKISNVD